MDIENTIVKEKLSVCICTQCKKEFSRTRKTKRSGNIFCSKECARNFRSQKNRDSNIPLKQFRKNVDWNNETKTSLKSVASSWQSWRTTVRRHSLKVMTENNIEYSCIVCGYKKHNEICHIKSVSEFSDDAKLSEINNISNLQYMCPTHHWEFDNLPRNNEDKSLSKP
jgi:hypothetical protein